MESKPLNVRVHQIVYGRDAILFPAAGWVVWYRGEGDNEEWCEPGKYDSDDHAALDLLKAAKRNAVCDEWSIGELPHSVFWCRLFKKGVEISYADNDDSLALAICQALDATKEKSC